MGKYSGSSAFSQIDVSSEACPFFFSLRTPGAHSVNSLGSIFHRRRCFSHQRENYRELNENPALTRLALGSPRCSAGAQSWQAGEK